MSLLEVAVNHWTGMIVESPFGGEWILRLPDGNSLSLLLPPGTRPVSGDMVEVTGKISGDLVSIDMVGPVVEVDRIRSIVHK